MTISLYRRSDDVVMRPEVLETEDPEVIEYALGLEDSEVPEGCVRLEAVITSGDDELTVIMSEEDAQELRRRMWG